MTVLDSAICPVEPESRAFTDRALTDLRAGGWSPQAWARFTASVTIRSGQQVVAHPRAAAEISLLHGTFAVVARRRGRRWIALSWLMAVTHLGLLGGRRSIGWPNAITLARANLAVTGQPLGPWIGVVALFSDKLDGTLARRQMPSMFGFYADSLADAAFWTWLATGREPSRLLRAASLAAWVAPAAAVTVASIARGEIVEGPRPGLVRPAAALQAVLAVRALRSDRLRQRRPAQRQRGGSDP
jgi:hypothetical protein